MTKPSAEAWLGLDESERIDAVVRYHKRVRFRAGSLQGHAVIHVVVENQLAGGHAAAVDTLQRLISEGLDRHEAVHAIGSLVARELYGALKSGEPLDDEEYSRRLRALNVAAWRSDVDE
jgi:hypothetical protein